jgi:hypothetical protein
MSGCAGNKMALTKGKSKIDLTKKSIALLSVRISNQDKPNRQLELQNVIICPQSETNCKHDLPSHYESPYKPYKKEKNHFNEYLLSYELKSGTYNIDGLYTTYRIPTLTAGFGFAKLNFKTEIKPNSISYLGHLDIVLRKKKSDAEISAGGNVPYIDQSIAGFSSGTFDVVVEDKFDEDMKSFISEYPALQKVKVEKSIFPQGIKPEKETVVAAPVTLKEVAVVPKIEVPVTPKEVAVVPRVEVPVTPKEVAVAPKVEVPVTPKEVAVAPQKSDIFASVSADNQSQFNSKKSDWVEFYTGKMGNVASYKKITAKKGQAKFFVKEVFSDKGRKEYIQDRKEKKLSIEGYDKLSNIQSLSEINCKQKMIMSISVSDFDTDGKKLDYYFVDKHKWVKIRNNSFFDSLRKEVCR